MLFAGNALPANQLLPPRRERPRREPAAEVPLRSRRRARAARPLRLQGSSTATATAKRPTASRSTVVRGTLPESWYREADTLWRKNMEAIGIRMQVNQQTFAELLNLSLAGQLPMFNLGYRSLEPSGLPDPADALGQGDARHQSVRIQASRLRRGVRGVPAHAGGARAHRARAQDVRHLAGLDADDPAHVRRRQRAPLPVGAGLLAVAVRRRVEVRRHRPREAAGRAR